jgi:hypothetical protein
LKRFLIVIVGLIVGACAAVVTSVEMRHLRSVASMSAWLPDWSEQLSPNSGVSQGHLVGFAQLANGGPLSATWRYHAITSRGVTYQVDIDADGVALSARVIWPFFTRQLEVVEATGEISAVALIGTRPRLALGGAVLVQSAQGQMRLYPSPQIGTLAAKAVWRNASLEGLALGNVTLVLQSMENRGWVVTTQNPGPPLAMSGTFVGEYDSVSAQADVAMVGADAIAPTLRQQLDRELAPIENGWAIRQEIILPLPHLTLTLGE